MAPSPRMPHRPLQRRRHPQPSGPAREPGDLRPGHPRRRDHRGKYRRSLLPHLRRGNWEEVQRDGAAGLTFTDQNGTLKALSFAKSGQNAATLADFSVSRLTACGTLWAVWSCWNSPTSSSSGVCPLYSYRYQEGTTVCTPCFPWKLQFLCRAHPGRPGRVGGRLSRPAPHRLHAGSGAVRKRDISAGNSRPPRLETRGR